ncbi:hypothetical protein RRF57_012573 [Xylaria bambusicola]|uniref:Uncharacterized protein n=1 Tax=Xylaria bambusicola TaxID=326684 RepID=A0AAN7ZAT9_9PEZI
MTRVCSYQSYQTVSDPTPGNTPSTVVAPCSRTGVTRSALPSMNCRSASASQGSSGNSHANARIVVDPVEWLRKKVV